MSQEEAYQLALRFFKAGENGEPMPEIPSKEARPCCESAYKSGQKYKQ